MTSETPVILLIEDNPDHAEMIIRLVRRYHVAARVKHLSDGEAALEYLLRRAGDTGHPACPVPRLIIMDLRLPKVDGLDLLKQIKASESLRRIPVVVLTTSDAESDIARATRLHANSYLVKPMDLAAFGSMIETLGTYWLMLNRH